MFLSVWCIYAIITIVVTIAKPINYIEPYNDPVKLLREDAYGFDFPVLEPFTKHLELEESVSLSTEPYSFGEDTLCKEKRQLSKIPQADNKHIQRRKVLKSLDFEKDLRKDKIDYYKRSLNSNTYNTRSNKKSENHKQRRQIQKQQKKQKKIKDPISIPKKKPKKLSHKLKNQENIEKTEKTEKQKPQFEFKFIPEPFRIHRVELSKDTPKQKPKRPDLLNIDLKNTLLSEPYKINFKSKRSSVNEVKLDKSKRFLKDSKTFKRNSSNDVKTNTKMHYLDGEERVKKNLKANDVKQQSTVKDNPDTPDQASSKETLSVSSPNYKFDEPTKTCDNRKIIETSTTTQLRQTNNDLETNKVVPSQTAAAVDIYDNDKSRVFDCERNAIINSAVRNAVENQRKVVKPTKDRNIGKRARLNEIQNLSLVQETKSKDDKSDNFNFHLFNNFPISQDMIFINERDQKISVLNLSPKFFDLLNAKLIENTTKLEQSINFNFHFLSNVSLPQEKTFSNEAIATMPSFELNTKSTSFADPKLFETTQEVETNVEADDTKFDYKVIPDFELLNTNFEKIKRDKSIDTKSNVSSNLFNIPIQQVETQINEGDPDMKSGIKSPSDVVNATFFENTPKDKKNMNNNFHLFGNLPLPQKKVNENEISRIITNFEFKSKSNDIQTDPKFLEILKEIEAGEKKSEYKYSLYLKPHQIYTRRIKRYTPLDKEEDIKNIHLSKRKTIPINEVTSDLSHLKRTPSKTIDLSDWKSLENITKVEQVLNFNFNFIRHNSLPQDRIPLNDVDPKIFNMQSNSKLPHFTDPELLDNVQEVGTHVASDETKFEYKFIPDFEQLNIINTRKNKRNHKSNVLGQSTNYDYLFNIPFLQERIEINSADPKISHLELESTIKVEQNINFNFDLPHDKFCINELVRKMSNLDLNSKSNDFTDPKRLENIQEIEQDNKFEYKFIPDLQPMNKDVRKTKRSDTISIEQNASNNNLLEIPPLSQQKSRIFESNSEISQVKRSRKSLGLTDLQFLKNLSKFKQTVNFNFNFINRTQLSQEKPLTNEDNIKMAKFPLNEKLADFTDPEFLENVQELQPNVELNENQFDYKVVPDFAVLSEDERKFNRDEAKLNFFTNPSTQENSHVNEANRDILHLKRSLQSYDLANANIPGETLKTGRDINFNFNLFKFPLPQQTPLLNEIESKELNLVNDFTDQKLLENDHNQLESNIKLEENNFDYKIIPEVTTFNNNKRKFKRSEETFNVEPNVKFHFYHNPLLQESTEINKAQTDYKRSLKSFNLQHSNLRENIQNTGRNINFNFHLFNFALPQEAIHLNRTEQSILNLGLSPNLTDFTDLKLLENEQKLEPDDSTFDYKVIPEIDRNIIKRSESSNIDPEVNFHFFHIESPQEFVSMNEEDPNISHIKWKRQCPHLIKSKFLQNSPRIEQNVNFNFQFSDPSLTHGETPVNEMDRKFSNYELNPTPIYFVDPKFQETLQEIQPKVEIEKKKFEFKFIPDIEAAPINDFKSKSVRLNLSLPQERNLINETKPNKNSIVSQKSENILNKN